MSAGRGAAQALRTWWLLGGLALAVAGAPGALAHESRPAYLEIKETAPERYDVLWRTPLNGGTPLQVALEFPDGTRNLIPPAVQALTDSLVERRMLAVSPGLAGRRISFLGLEGTITDVLVRVELLDGRKWTAIVHPSRAWFEVKRAPGRLATVSAFIVQGMRHILFGVDHLLFVLGLLLIVKDRWMLVKTISAFTVAHSITLAVATLGWATIAAVPLNAAIALSILFLGPEIVRSWRVQTSFTLRHPWVVAFVFGLLHGFGFASALTSAGLPSSELPWALLSFNIGVEIGQLGFVTLVLVLEHAFRVLEINWPRALRSLPGYVVGSLGAFWTIQRVAILFGIVQ